MASCILRCLMLIFFVFGLSLTVIYASSACGLCPAGFYQKSCANDSHPICVKCPEDTYNSVANNFPSCHRCSGCSGKNNIVVKACNGTHDSVCRCRPGYWYDNGALFCVPCKSCGRGRGVVSKCTYNANTVCRKCLKGKTYSPYRSSSEGCLKCRKCPKGERVVRNCTRRLDTICAVDDRKPNYVNKLENKSKVWPPLVDPTKTTGKKTESTPDMDTLSPVDEDNTASTAFQELPEDETKADENGLDATLKLVLIISGSCIAFILAVLTVACISRWRKRRLEVKKSAPPRTQVICTVPAPTIQHNRLSTMPLVSNGSTDKLFRDVPYTLTDHLSRHLNPKGRWKVLAGNLGFSTLNIENFDIQPTLATSAMLYEWGQRRESTLHALYETLIKMKWNSEADIVRKFL